MAIKIASSKPVEYTPVNDRESELKTVLVFKQIPSEQIAGIQDTLIALNKKGRASAFRMRTIRLKVAREMLCDWRNVFNERGDDVPFDPSRKELMYDLLGADLQKELEDRFGDGSLNWQEAELKMAEEKAKEESAVEDDDESDAA